MHGRAARAALTLCVMVLAGCSGEPEEQPLDSLPPPPTTSAPAPTTSEPAPTTSAAPTGAPALPPEASEQTPEGAAAFVQHWFDTLEYSWNAMDSAPLRELGECATCIAFADTIDSVVQRGNHLEGNEVTVRNLSPNAVLGDGSTSVVALFDAPAQSEVDPQGTVVEVIESAVADIQYLFDLSWSGSTWVVAAIRLIE